MMHTRAKPLSHTTCKKKEARWLSKRIGEE